MIEYKIVEKVVRNGRGSLGLRYVAQLVSAGRMGGSETVAAGSRETLLPESAVESVLAALERVMERGLTEGRVVKVPHVGVFRCGIEGRSASTREEAERGVARLRVNYLPSPLLRKEVHWDKARRAGPEG